MIGNIGNDGSKYFDKKDEVSFEIISDSKLTENDGERLINIKKVYLWC